MCRMMHMSLWHTHRLLEDVLQFVRDDGETTALRTHTLSHSMRPELEKKKLASLEQQKQYAARSAAPTLGPCVPREAFVPISAGTMVSAAQIRYVIDACARVACPGGYAPKHR